MEQIRGQAVLAPMAGVTSLPFRRICRRYNAPLTVTEMISARGLCYAPGNLEQESILRKDPGEPILAQIFGRDPGCMAEAAQRLSTAGYLGIDINMGCPAKKVTSAGDGSALLKTPKLAVEIASAVVRATSLPVSVKLRLGWDSDSPPVDALCQALEDAGVACIVLHGRTRRQQYSGKADWRPVERLVRSLKIPVIGNGDIVCAEDARKRLSETGCHAVMIGRGALGNPWIFSQIAALGAGREVCLPAPRERIETALSHLQEQIDFSSPRIAVLEMRKHMGWYLYGLRGATETRQVLNHVSDTEQMRAVMLEFLDNLEKQG